MPFWAPIPLVVVALIYALLTTRSAKDADEGTEVASANLAAVGAMTDQLYSGRLPSSVSAIQAAHQRRRHLLELERDTALERVRVAQRKWEELAGEDADPAEVEELLVRRDPQRHRAAPWVSEAASVRTATLFHETSREAWRDAWHAVGREAPSTADTDTAISQVEAEARLLVAAQQPIIAVAAAGGTSGRVDRPAPAGRRDRARSRRRASGDSLARGAFREERYEKDWPQPQVFCALGLLIENPAPWRPSL